MSKVACKKKNYQEPEHSLYSCKKCGVGSVKKEKLCKPKKN